MEFCFNIEDLDSPLFRTSTFLDVKWTVQDAIEENRPVGTFIWGDFSKARPFSAEVRAAVIMDLLVELERCGDNNAQADVFWLFVKIAAKYEDSGCLNPTLQKDVAWRVWMTEWLCDLGYIQYIEFDDYYEITRVAGMRKAEW